MQATLSDYAGRRIDVLALNGAIVGQDVLLVQSLALPGEGGKVIAGIEKLVQRFYMELMTELGSMQVLPTRGCLFMAQARRGLWRTPADVERSFYESMIIVRRNLILEESETDPADERFADAVLTNVSITMDSVTLRIELTSLAGSSREFIYPLPFPLTQII